MAFNIYNIKKWYLMLTGKSVLHVNQDIGPQFVPGELKGYFNNMTEKVTKEPELLESDSLPLLQTEKGEYIYFPVAIFQYGLGAYDLYLSTNDEIYLKKFKLCVKWAIDNQEINGSWSNFFYIYPNSPYGAMCQGEGASLLLRAYKEFGDVKFLECAKKAIDYMLLPVEEGGTALYQDNEVILLEYTHRPAVLNGWIFALFGLYDLTLVDNSDKYNDALQKTLYSLKNNLNKFDNCYWSLYDLDNKITSPFYHNLHIAQMQAIYEITNDQVYKQLLEKWINYRNSFCKSKKAFIKKAIQKIVEK